MKHFLSVLLFFILSSNLYAQKNLTPQFTKVVTFLHINNKNTLAPYGTGFLVSIPAQNVNGKYIYLVTAQHVLLDGNKQPLIEIYAKFNTSDSSEMTRIVLTWGGPQKTVFLHKNPNVDIAVIPIVIPSNFEYATIDHKTIVKRSEFKDLNIDLGTQVFFTGLFTAYTGRKKNTPIFRFGRLCLLPDEPILFDNVNRELLLIESSTFGGNSGSPVIISHNNLRGDSTFVRLGGVVLGSFNQGQILKEAVADSFVVWNSLGVSAITPAEFILDILNSYELSKIRNQ